MKLQYINENDRAFGLAGMAISLAALDAIDSIIDISLDTDGPMVSFSHEYYFSGSPSVSPKAAWNNLVKNFYITSTMVVSNVMARALVKEGEEVPQNLLDTIRQEMQAEGLETCSLESDEVDRLYNRSMSGMHRIFSNSNLYPAIKEFADMLMHRRTLTGNEIYEELRALRLI